MGTDQKLENTRKEVQRKIGRNLLLYQQLEHMLKYLVANGKISGSSKSELDQNKISRKSSVGTKSMGQVVEPFLETIFTKPKDTFVSSEDNENFRIEFSFTVEENEGFNQDSKRLDLSEIIADRNELVHHLMQKYKQPDSIEGWLEIDIYLEKQREKALPELELLRNMINNIQNGRKKLAEYLVSGEYAKGFSTDQRE